MSKDELALKLSQIQIDQARLLSQMSQFFSKSGETGVILWLSQRKTPAYSVDIVDHFGLTPGRVANIIKKLEEHGYILRQQDDEDLRKAHIILTPEGKEIARAEFERMNSSNGKIVEELGEEDTVQWIDLLTKMSKVFGTGISSGR
ncbi:MAG: MarR family transcriptional regulator [Firmicutes bacterium]|nr:MarR family transcriptional regulator [Bacillota bacterium]